MTHPWTAPATEMPTGRPRPKWVALDETDRGRGWTINAVSAANFRGNVSYVATNLSKADAELIVELYDEWREVQS